MGDVITIDRTIAAAVLSPMAKAGGITHKIAAAVFADAFSGYVGLGRLSIEDLAGATDIPARTLRSYQSGEATPGLLNLLRIACVLPASFSNDLIALAGLGGARRLDGEAKSVATVGAAMADELRIICGTLEDGRIDHKERAVLLKTLGKLADDISDLRAKLAREAA